MRRRTERGQALVLAAIMITVLIGFVGLVVDGGEAANEQQVVRAAADGAALAGVYSISTGTTTAAATVLAQQVLVAVPLPTSDLIMSYLDAGGSPTVITANVVTVRAVVADSHPTFFLAALGKPTLVLAATAEAKYQAGASGVPAACAVCLMSPGGIGLNVSKFGSTTVSGGVLHVNSNGGGAITEATQASITAPTVNVVGGVQQQGNGTITPSPVTVTAIADPLVAIPVPSVAGAATNFTAPGGTSALAPGVYNTVTVNAGSTLTLAGNYAIRAQLFVNGGTVNGTGVTIYLGCANYPTACTVGQSGAFISVAAGTLTLSAPASGTYFGLTVFGDRNNVATNTFSGSTINVTGTWYSVLQPMTDATDGDTLNFGQLVIASYSQTRGTTFTAARSATGSYGTGVGVSSLRLTL